MAAMLLLISNALFCFTCRILLLAFRNLSGGHHLMSF